MRLVGGTAICSVVIWCIATLIRFAHASPDGDSHAAAAPIVEWTDANVAALDDKTGERLILFYANWCSACVRYKPQFRSFAQHAGAKHPRLEIVQVDLDASPQLSGRFRISYLPTLFHERDGVFRQIDAHRGNLDRYFDQQEWTKVPPISSLVNPHSPAARVLGRTAAVGSSLTRLSRSFGLATPGLLALVGGVVLVVMLFAVWLVWLVTDSKLRQHSANTNSVISAVPSTGTASSDEDSGNESDTEPEETAPPADRGRRNSLTNRLKLKSH